MAADVIDILVPPEQEGTKAVVRAWLKKLGDQVALDEPLVELDTDKVSQEIPSPGAGILAEILIDADADVTPGLVLGRLRIADAPAAVAAAESPTAESTAHPLPAPVNAHLSPSVRRAVVEHGVDPTGLTGTGRGGRLTRADIDRVVAERAMAPADSAAQSPDAPVGVLLAAVTDAPSKAASSPAEPPRSRSIPHDRMRLAIAENMLRSVTVAPHVTAVFEADFSAVAAHRRKHKAAYEREGLSLTYTAYIVSAVVEAMKISPTVNSRWHSDRLEVFEDVNVGVGTALGDKGLVVPVIRQAQQLSLQGIASRLADLTLRARDARLAPEDVRGGTFTISNHGVSGSLIASPIIIAQPQSAILGVGKLEKRVVARETDGVDCIQIRPMAYVSLTIDHRVIDGHQTNAWLTRFVEVIQSWPQ